MAAPAACAASLSPGAKESASASSPDAGEPRMWRRSDFELGAVLGQGTFSRVRLMREPETNSLAALKQVSKHQVAKLRARRCLERELQIQAHLRHGNVIRLFGYFWDRSYIYLILEYAPNGDLGKLLATRGALGEAAPAAVRPLLLAVEYLHNLSVIHRDIKPENLLLGRRGAVKLSDFGWAVQSLPGERRRTVCGTLDYLAPEMVLACGHGAEVDLWAVGVTAFECLMATPPFTAPTPEETYKRILQCTFRLPGSVALSAHDFVGRLLQPTPEDRVGCQAALAHEWLAGEECPQVLAELLSKA